MEYSSKKYNGCGLHATPLHDMMLSYLRRFIFDNNNYNVMVLCFVCVEILSPHIFTVHSGAWTCCVILHWAPIRFVDMAEASWYTLSLCKGSEDHRIEKSYVWLFKQCYFIYRLCSIVTTYCLEIQNESDNEERDDRKLYIWIHSVKKKIT